MRGNDVHRRASRRINCDHRQTATSAFDARLLRDGVDDDVCEDTQLAHVEDAIARLEDVRERRRDELADAPGDAAEEVARSLAPLQKTARVRVEEICAERCRLVLTEGDTWLAEGWATEDEVAAAKREAANWLLEHRDVCERAFGGVPADAD